MASHGGHNARLWLVALLVLGIYAGLLGRLAIIQGKDQDRFREMAAAQHVVAVKKPERRGSIQDSRGRTLAVSVQTPSIYADPGQMESPREAAGRLAAILGLDATLLASRLERPMGLVCLKRGLSPQAEQALRNEPAIVGLGRAVEVRGGAVFARPAEVREPKATAAVLAPLLGRPAEDIEPDLDGLRRFVWVLRKASDEQARRVAAARLEGVGIVPEYKRSYPQGELACQLIGFTDLDEEGIEGLEQRYNDWLAPQAASGLLERDAAGRYISTPAPQKAPRAGADIELALDSVIQGYAEAALHDAWELWAPKGAFAVVLDPRSGDILAAASLPSYDPNKYSEYDPRDLKNRARARYIVDMMEPGSIFKPFIFAGAFTERVVSEETPIFCENGVWLIGSRRFRDVHAYGTLDAAMVLVKSSNIGTAKIGRLLGPERIYRYLRDFGFGQLTGFELPGENPGVLRPPSRWTSFSLPSICVGQEVCATPIQMALAYGAIANDGLLLRPRVVKRVKRLDGTWSECPVRPAGRVISPAIAGRLRRILCRVVEEGTGKAAKLAAYTVGGKTGTAQKPTIGGFSRTAVMCSFVGMAPIERPQLVVIVTLDEPTKHTGGRHFGGTVAAPVVARILKQSLAYLGVAPDKPQALERLGIGSAQP